MAKYVLEGRRWLRLALLFAASFICAGLGPGAAAWIPLFADAGVFSSMCSPGAGAGATCDEQKVAIAQAFAVGGFVTLIGVLSCGYYFDRFGANWAGRVGAMIAALGLLLLSAVVYGAREGYDAQTSGLIVPAICIMDFGAMLNSWCIYGLLYHFPDYQTVVVAIMAACYQGVAVVPMLTAMLQSWTHVSLDYVLFAWFALAVLSYFACRFAAPSVEEYDDYAVRLLGFAPRTNTASVCSRLNDGNRVLCQNWGRHTCLILAMAALSNGASFYMGLSSVYEDKLLGKGAGEVLANHFALYSGGLSILFTPTISYLGDKCSNSGSFKIYMALLVLFPVVCAVLVATPTWPAQEAAGASIAMVGVLNYSFLTKYLLAYAVPSRFGLVLGVFLLWMGLATMVMMGGTYGWMASLPSGSLEALLLPIRGATWVGAAVFAAWCAHCLCVGLPKTLVLLPDDEKEIAAEHGCADFDEMAYQTGLKSRDEVITMLSDPKSEHLHYLKWRAANRDRACDWPILGWFMSVPLTCVYTPK